MTDALAPALIIGKVSTTMAFFASIDIPIYTVLNLPKSRVGAKLVTDYLKEITSEEVLKELEHIRLVNKSVHSNHDQKGRPTKRERRKWDDLNE